MAEDTPTAGKAGGGSGKKKPPRLFRKVPCTRITDEQVEEILHEVIEETPYALFVNGRHMMTAMMTPADLEDFVTGFLFTEQVIKGPEEIESIRVEKNRISVITTNLFRVVGPKKTILSGCGGSTSYIDSEKLPNIRSDFSVGSGGIADLIKQTLTSELHQLTGGIHVVALAGAEGIITVSEDIGRHNALDRVIGYGLRNGIDFSRTFILVSGRVSSEMARKCLIANIPIIASRGATTTLALEVAVKNGLTIVGFVRGSKMNVYTHTKRIKITGRQASSGST
ncbi:MAG TPA: formate dehydrogenase accessory sulfurtransferase FdhD [Methanoregulaceae archaeon]|nr:formate dehydrogenase accessory sulfurtransferase FdhD [Methanoregulaceae archaeon]